MLLHQRAQRKLYYWPFLITTLCILVIFLVKMAPPVRVKRPAVRQPVVQTGSNRTTSTGKFRVICVDTSSWSKYGLGIFYDYTLYHDR